MKKRNFAFTLAETLIVIGIIGVVAALTIPTLNSDTNNKDKVTKVKKAYTVLEDAFGRMASEYGPLDEWSSDVLTSERVANKMAAFMKVNKKCIASGDISGNCFAAGAKMLKTTGGLTTDDINGNVSSFVLSDSMSVAFDVAKDAAGTNAECQSVTGFNVSKVCGMAVIDVDGAAKGKNTHGLDLFAFYLTPDGLVPVGLENDGNYKSVDSKDDNCINGAADAKYACTAWVVYNGNMDYNKPNATTCVDGTNGLSWEKGKTTCND